MKKNLRIAKALLKAARELTSKDQNLNMYEQDVSAQPAADVWVEAAENGRFDNILNAITAYINATLALRTNVDKATQSFAAYQEAVGKYRKASDMVLYAYKSGDPLSQAGNSTSLEQYVLDAGRVTKAFFRYVQKANNTIDVEFFTKKIDEFGAMTEDKFNDVRTDYALKKRSIDSAIMPELLILNKAIQMAGLVTDFSGLFDSVGQLAELIHLPEKEVQNLINMGIQAPETLKSSFMGVIKRHTRGTLMKDKKPIPLNSELEQHIIARLGNDTNLLKPLHNNIETIIHPLDQKTHEMINFSLAVINSANVLHTPLIMQSFTDSNRGFITNPDGTIRDLDNDPVGLSATWNKGGNVEKKRKPKASVRRRTAGLREWGKSIIDAVTAIKDTICSLVGLNKKMEETRQALEQNDLTGSAQEIIDLCGQLNRQ